MTRATTGLLALVVVLGAGAAEAQRQRFTWDVPRVVRMVDVPDIMMADGIPVKARAVLSSERPEVVARHIVDRFLSWGFHVPPAHKQPQLLREPMITAIDTRAFITYTAIIQANADGSTTVILGEANLSQGRQRQSSVAPVYPGGGGLLTAESEGARTLTYSAPGKVADVEAFYRTELGKAGFQEVEPRLFRSAADELRLSVTPGQEGRVAVVVVRRPVPPEARDATGD